MPYGRSREAQRGDGRRIGTRRKALYALVTTAVVLGFIELVMRAGECGGENRSYLSSEGLPAGTAMPYRPVAGQYGACGVSEQGLWGDEVAVPPPPGVLRVIAVGGSSVQGCCPCSIDTASFPVQLQLLLAEQQPTGFAVEVLNAGVEGFHAAAVAEWLGMSVLPLLPDVVLVYSGWNDITRVGARVDAVGDLVDPLIERSALAHELTRAVHELRQRTGSLEVEGDSAYLDHVPREFIESLRRIVQDCRAAGTTPVLMTQTSNLRPDMSRGLARSKVILPAGVGSVEDLHALWLVHREATRLVAVEEGVPFIDTTGAMDRPDADELMFDHMHPETEGYRVLAEWIAPRLMPTLEGVAAEK